MNKLIAQQQRLNLLQRIQNDNDQNIHVNKNESNSQLMNDHIICNANKKVTLFMHLHKCAGTSLITLARANNKLFYPYECSSRSQYHLYL